MQCAKDSSKWGGFLLHVDQFASFFAGLSPYTTYRKRCGGLARTSIFIALYGFQRIFECLLDLAYSVAGASDIIRLVKWIDDRYRVLPERIPVLDTREIKVGFLHLVENGDRVVKGAEFETIFG